jgi:uncharacterized membrane protein
MISVPTRVADEVRTPSQRHFRVESVDVVRGIIMIVMALDHTRDYFGDVTANPTNMATTTAALFFTRWITHICAPGFFLLTGVSAYLSGQRRGRGDLARFLLTRGLWLVLLELTVMRFIVQFNVDYQVTALIVLWALGWSMIALAGLIYLPTWAIATVGAVMIAGHNVLDSVQASSFGAFAPLWLVLHQPGILIAKESFTVFEAYPLIPWIGVTALGYALGQVFTWPADRRRALLLRLGLAVTLAFLVLRALNVYGDPRPWREQVSPLFTVFSFINTTKYPASLLFLLMTLGPILLLLRAFDGKTPRWLEPVRTIGKVPLFYFVLHFFLIHLAAVVAAYLRYDQVHWLFESPSLDRFPYTQPPGWPASLPVVYAVWIGVVLACYPLCRWYADLKSRRRSVWLSYL